MTTPPLYASIGQRFCEEASIKAPVGLRDQLGSLLAFFPGDLGLPGPRSCAATALAILEGFDLLPAGAAGSPHPTPSLGADGSEIPGESFELSVPFHSMFFLASCEWAQAEHRARRLGLPPPLWGGVCAPDHCFEAGAEPGVDAVRFDRFSPFERVLQLRVPKLGPEILTGHCPQPILSDPARLRAARSVAVNLARFSDGAHPWIQRALDLAPPRSHPLLPAWSTFADYAADMAEGLEQGDIRFMGRDEMEMLIDFEEVTLFAVHVEPDNQPSGYLNRYFQPGMLADARLFGSLDKARHAAGQHANHAIARVTLRAEAMEEATPGCRAASLRSLQARRDRRAIEGVLDRGSDADFGQPSPDDGANEEGAPHREERGGPLRI